MTKEVKDAGDKSVGEDCEKSSEHCWKQCVKIVKQEKRKNWLGSAFISFWQLKAFTAKKVIAKLRSYGEPIGGQTGQGPPRSTEERRYAKLPVFSDCRQTAGKPCQR